jgi:hypothetical protein
MRFRLTREKREHLKSLGLQKYVITSWPKPDPHHSILGRWIKNKKKTLLKRYKEAKALEKKKKTEKEIKKEQP